MILLKKLIGGLLLPSGLIGTLFISSAIAWLFGWRRTARMLYFATALIFLLASNRFFAESLIRPLELGYQPYNVEALPAVTQRSVNPVTHIVVLAGGTFQDGWRMPADTLNKASLRRTLEGIRLQKSWPDLQLVFSGGGLQHTAAQTMADYARSVGVPAHRFSVESTSRDTHEAALQLKAELLDAPFLLVTTASHMPRAMALFEKQGLRPVAAPTEFVHSDELQLTLRSMLPSAYALSISNAAIYEYLGLAWSRIRGHI